MELTASEEGMLVMVALLLLVAYSAVLIVRRGMSVGVIAGFIAVPILHWLYVRQGQSAESVMVWSLAGAVLARGFSGWQPWVSTKAAAAPEA